MAGTTYSRSGGRRILPGSWAYVRSRGTIPPGQILAPEDRFAYDAADAETRSAFDTLALQPATRPPEFLVFALARGADALPDYPGASDGLDGKASYPPNARLPEGVTEERFEEELRLRPGELEQRVLPAFHGMIDRTMLDVGAILYRTVGLLVDAKNLHDGVTTHDGVITNRLIGDGLYFERRSPNSYTSESEWRASMAVLKEWNGDFGYIMVRLKHTTPAITGQVSLQRLPRMGPRMVLPGGGSQVYIPHLCLEDVEVVLSDGSVGALAAHSLSDIIHETRFGSDGASL